MEEQKECNILLTAYSTIYEEKGKGYHRLTFLDSEDHSLDSHQYTENCTYTEFSFMDKSLVTSETALKYLVLPKLAMQAEGPIEINKIFAFTTSKVEEENVDSVTNVKKTIDFAVEDGNNKYHLSNSGNEGKFETQQDFIEARLKAVYSFAHPEHPKLDIDSVCIEGEERGIEYSIKYIFDLIEKITKYISEMEANHQTVNVYVDMTGGFRSVPMYLLFILNILEKRGLTIKGIYYSQMNNNKTVKIDDLMLLMRTQDFTNGIHEFIQFGSAQELKKYFNSVLELCSEDTYEPKYKKIIEGILESVEEFAEAITISNQTEFEKSVKKIKDAWDVLDTIEVEKLPKLDKDEKIEIGRYIENRNLRLLKTFSPKIKEEYKTIWPLQTGDIKSRLAYIDWCLKHNFIQQALTLYIELVPEVLFKSSDDKIDIDRQSMHIMEVLDEKNLKSSWGKSEYKFKYWLLNQYNASIDTIRAEQAKNEITPARNMCKEILIKFSQRTPNEWTEKPELTIKDFFEKAKQSFAKKIDKKYTNNKESIDLNFNFEDTLWKMSTLNQSEFEYNWKKLIELFSNPTILCNFCIDVLDSIIELAQHIDWKNTDIKSITDITGKLGELVNEFIPLPSLADDINHNEKDKYNIEEMNALNIYKGPFVYGCLKAKIQEKLSLVIIENINKKMLENLISTGIQDFNNSSINECIDNMIVKNMSCAVECKKNIDYKKIIEEALGTLKTEVIEVRDGIAPFKIRKAYMRVSDVKDDILENILLPRNINKIEFAEFPELGNEIASMDKYARVNDIENLVVNNKVRIDQKILNAFLEKQKDFKLDVRDILKLIQSLEGYNKEKAEKILKQYLQIIPESIGGYAAPKDMWGRDTLTVLILRILLYPYNILKLIRNDSVHAREERNLNVTRDDIRRLIEKSIATIEKYLDVVK